MTNVTFKELSYQRRKLTGSSGKEQDLLQLIKSNILNSDPIDKKENNNLPSTSSLGASSYSGFEASNTRTNISESSLLNEISLDLLSSSQTSFSLLGKNMNVKLEKYLKILPTYRNVSRFLFG